MPVIFMGHFLREIGPQNFMAQTAPRKTRILEPTKITASKFGGLERGHNYPTPSHSHNPHPSLFAGTDPPLPCFSGGRRGSHGTTSGGTA